MIADVQDVVATALGAEPVTTTVEGRERYTVAIRYPRDLRSDPQAIAKDVLVPLPGGGTVPLGEVADINLTQGATSIRTENASSRPISSSISATATSAATSPTRRSGGRASTAAAGTYLAGVVSSSICSAPRRGCRWWCR